MAFKKKNRELYKRITVRVRKEDMKQLRDLKKKEGLTFAGLARKALFDTYGIGDGEEC